MPDTPSKIVLASVGSGRALTRRGKEDRSEEKPAGGGRGNPRRQRSGCHRVCPRGGKATWACPGNGRTGQFALPVTSCPLPKRHSMIGNPASNHASPPGCGPVGAGKAVGSQWAWMRVPELQVGSRLEPVAAGPEFVPASAQFGCQAGR